MPNEAAGVMRALFLGINRAVEVLQLAAGASLSSARTLWRLARQANGDSWCGNR